MRRPDAKNKSNYHFHIKKYRDLDKKIPIGEYYFITGYDVAEFLNVKYQKIFDYMNCKTATKKKESNPLCYCDIERGFFPIKPLEQSFEVEALPQLEVADAQVPF